jgi:hypothetical protein
MIAKDCRLTKEKAPYELLNLRDHVNGLGRRARIPGKWGAVASLQGPATVRGRELGGYGDAAPLWRTVLIGYGGRF